MSAAVVFLALLAAGFAYADWCHRPRRGRYRASIDLEHRLADVHQRIATHPDLAGLDQHMDEIARLWGRRP